jgi:hypothetical protein
MTAICAKRTVGVDGSTPVVLDAVNKVLDLQIRRSAIYGAVDIHRPRGEAIAADIPYASKVKLTSATMSCWPTPFSALNAASCSA